MNYPKHNVSLCPLYVISFILIICAYMIKPNIPTSKIVIPLPFTQVELKELLLQKPSNPLSFIGLYIDVVDSSGEVCYTNYRLGVTHGIGCYYLSCSI